MRLAYRKSGINLECYRAMVWEFAYLLPGICHEIVAGIDSGSHEVGGQQAGALRGSRLAAPAETRTHNLHPFINIPSAPLPQPCHIRQSL